MAVSLNFTGVTAGLSFEPVPNGTYPVAVHKVTPKTSQTGKPMLEWVFEITEDAKEGSGHRIFTNTILTKESLWRTMQFLLALGYTQEELSGEFELDPAELVGLQATAAVSVKEYNGQKRNEIGNLMPYRTPGNAPLPDWAGTSEEEEELDEPIGEFSMADVDEVEGDYESEPEPEAEYTIPDNVKMSASAREYAIKNKIDLSQVKATGPSGTYLLTDLKKAIPS